MGPGVEASISDDPIETDPPIRLGNSVLGLRRHVCAFFNSPDEQYGVPLPFIKDGIDRGEKAVHIIDPNRRDEHVQWLRSVGIDAVAMQQVGTLDLRDWANAHLQDGRFSGDVVIGVMRTHPMIIIGGILQENPFFVPPDEFLRERRGGHPATPPPPLD